MPKIFISYRRKDTALLAQLIYNELTKQYGAESVVFDVDSIPLGIDFVEFLNREVSECDVFLAVIGDRWLENRRIDDPDDFVRIEIQAALRRKIPVIPVLAGETTIPAASLLPDELKELSRRNAIKVRTGKDLSRDLESLVKGIDGALQYVSSTPLVADNNAGQGTFGNKREVFSNSIGLTVIPAGSFQIGSSIDTEPHQVSVDGFALGNYEVTQAEYERVMKKNPSRFQGDDSCPVETVSWFDAISFCNLLSELEGLAKYYNVLGNEVTILGGEGYRLPTEAEWEYACRAGSKGAYCFGDDARQLGDYAWYEENSGGTTHPVGVKKPNAWGLYDMHGNVWEWCWDYYKKGSYRVRRGGSWFGDAGCCRSAYRCWYVPVHRYFYLGFRLARSSVKQDKTASRSEGIGGGEAKPSP